MVAGGWGGDAGLFVHFADWRSTEVRALVKVFDFSKSVMAASAIRPRGIKARGPDMNLVRSYSRRSAIG
jgi:hypothetical protein